MVVGGEAIPTRVRQPTSKVWQPSVPEEELEFAKDIWSRLSSGQAASLPALGNVLVG